MKAEQIFVLKKTPILTFAGSQVATACHIALSTILMAHVCLANPYTRIRDASFLSPDRPEKLDVYLPKAPASSPAPAIIVIHGGGWAGGSRSSRVVRDLAETFTQEGYVVFSISYKLMEYDRDERGRILYPVKVDAFPQNLYDCKSAIQWVRKQAKTYGVDPARIALIGYSAGGHLALLTGMTHGTNHDTGGLYPDFSTEVSGIITLYGPTNLRWFGSHMFHGPTEHKMDDYSPINYIGADIPPLLIIHGTADGTVSYGNATRFVDALIAFEAKEAESLDYTMITVGGGGHHFNISPQKGNRNTDLRPQTLEFLRRIFSDAE